MSSAAMSRVAHVLERMANQNTFADVGMDFRVCLTAATSASPFCHAVVLLIFSVLLVKPAYFLVCFSLSYF